MSSNYFNLGGGADITAGSSLNRCQELLTIDGDSPWEVLQAGGIGGGVTETRAYVNFLPRNVLTKVLDKCS